MSHDQHHHDPADQSPIQPAPNAPPSGAAPHPERVTPTPTRASDAPAESRDGILRPIQQSDYFSPGSEEAVSSHINRYFNQALDIFPAWESEGKPDRFHVLFDRQINERFPADEDLRGRVTAYGRRVFHALRTHILVKRLNQAVALGGLASAAIWGPAWLTSLTGSQPLGLGLTAGLMAVIVGLFYAIQSILFVQYRFRLENDSYELSREIVERTRELQNLFTTSRTLADQAETEYQQDGKSWGRRAMFLTRLTMWLGARTEYLEKHIQMELWRVRRERYWARWVARIITPLVYAGGMALLFLWPTPDGSTPADLALKGLAAALGLVVSWLSYFNWQSPVSAVQDKLAAESWVRYASLDVDNAVADQVRRDKERLVEYRALTRGGR